MGYEGCIQVFSVGEGEKKNLHSRLACQVCEPTRQSNNDEYDGIDVGHINDAGDDVTVMAGENK